MLAVDMLEGMLERICEWSDQTRAGSCLCDLVWPCAVKAEGSIPSGSFKVGGVIFLCGCQEVLICLTFQAHHQDLPN